MHRENELTTSIGGQVNLILESCELVMPVGTRMGVSHLIVGVHDGAASAETSISLELADLVLLREQLDQHITHRQGFATVKA
jgi:hypothetical protein